MRILNGILAFDQQIVRASRDSRHSLVSRSREISRTADGHFYLLIPMMAALFSARGMDLVYLTALAFALERPLYWVLKNSLRRRRPAHALADFQSVIVASDEFSFPSGHTSAAFLFVTLLYFYVGPIVLPLYLWSALVAVSRVCLGVHFPSDTLVGAALGVGIGIFCASLAA